jgi:hypothetical protein
MSPETERIPDESDQRPAPTRYAHAIAVVVAPLAFLLDPDDAGSRGDALSGFFPAALGGVLSLLIAIALFQGPLGDAVAHRVRRWVDRWTFAYLGAATVTAVAGTIGGLDDDVYRWLFAVTAGGGAASLFTVLAMGDSSIREQKKRSPGRAGG